MTSPTTSTPANSPCLPHWTEKMGQEAAEKCIQDFKENNIPLEQITAYKVDTVFVKHTSDVRSGKRDFPQCSVHPSYDQAGFDPDKIEEQISVPLRDLKILEDELRYPERLCRAIFKMQLYREPDKNTGKAFYTHIRMYHPCEVCKERVLFTTLLPKGFLPADYYRKRVLIPKPLTETATLETPGGADSSSKSNAPSLFGRAFGKRSDEI